MISEYIWIGLIMIVGLAIARYSLMKLIKSEKELGPENIEVNICPVCGSPDTTTTAENTAIGFNYRCKECGYTGTMLEMNLVQAKEYAKKRNIKK